MSDADADGGNEPNEYGFAGDATTPEPEPARRDSNGVPEHYGEDIAVPAGDVTGAISDAVSGDTD